MRTMTKLNYVLLTLITLVFATGCASIRGQTGVATARGVVQESLEIAKTNRYFSRDYAQGMGGALGLWMVDTFYEDPKHFSYTVLLDSGETIALRNKKELALGTCISMWLKPDPQSRAGYYPLKFNELEIATGCAAK
jgi:hypothetical protein